MFGQIKPLELSGNVRLLKNNGETIRNILNGYPLYAKSNNKEAETVILKYITDYPLYFLTNQPEQDVFLVADTYQLQTYKQIVNFTLETLQRFFKWLFTVDIQEINIPQTCESQTQLIDEGNIIFSYLWWDDVIVECDKDINPESALNGFLTSMTNSEIKQHINYYPERDCYVLKRLWLKDEPRKASVILYKVLKLAGKAWKDPLESHYIFIDKEFFEKCIPNVLSKNMKPIEIVNYFVSPELAITTTKYNTPKRSITKKELHKRLEAGMPGYTPDKFVKII